MYTCQAHEKYRSMHEHSSKVRFCFQAVTTFEPHPCLRLSSVQIYEFFNVRMTFRGRFFRMLN